MICYPRGYRRCRRLCNYKISSICTCNNYRRACPKSNEATVAVFSIVKVFVTAPELNAFEPKSVSLLVRGVKLLFPISTPFPFQINIWEAICAYSCNVKIVSSFIAIGIDNCNRCGTSACTRWIKGYHKV